MSDKQNDNIVAFPVMQQCDDAVDVYVPEGYEAIIYQGCVVFINPEYPPLYLNKDAELVELLQE